MRNSWRGLLIAAGALIAWGGSMHPGGTMEEMLADPRWLPGHMVTFAGFLAMGAGIWWFAKAASSMTPTLRFVLIATGLQALEMFVHAVANVDLDNLRAGRATPVLTTHLALTAAVYPVFGIAVAIWIASAARRRIIGSPWVAWLGILGALMHGAAGLLVAGFDVARARSLFPGIVFLALWLILAGVWPIKAPKAQRAATP
jgi:hypothetical protein